MNQRFHVRAEYIMEAAGLGLFMVSACAFAVLLFHPQSDVAMHITSPLLKRVIMGIAMGLTAIALIYSPWGKQSGAHLNPGMSMNPARTLASAVPSAVWTSFWIYLTAPPLAMLSAAQLYLVLYGRSRVLCAKLHHQNNTRCIFCLSRAPLQNPLLADESRNREPVIASKLM